MISTILMFASTVIAVHIPYQPIYAEGIDFKNFDNTENLGNNNNNNNALLSNSQKAISGRKVR